MPLFLPIYYQNYWNQWNFFFVLPDNYSILIIIIIIGRLLFSFFYTSIILVAVLLFKRKKRRKASRKINNNKIRLFHHHRCLFVCIRFYIYPNRLHIFCLSPLFHFHFHSLNSISNQIKSNKNQIIIMTMIRLPSPTSSMVITTIKRIMYRIMMATNPTTTTSTTLYCNKKCLKINNQINMMIASIYLIILIFVMNLFFVQGKFM